jgi:hypothetical protein
VGKEKQGHSKGLLEVMRDDRGRGRAKQKCCEVKGGIGEVAWSRPVVDCIAMTGPMMGMSGDEEEGGGQRY